MKTKTKEKEKRGTGNGERGTDVGELRRVPHGSCVLSPTNPPREDVEDLLQSIREQGIVQPLIVRPRPKYALHAPDLVDPAWRLTCGTTLVQSFDKEKDAREALAQVPKAEFEIVAGERRWRAAGKLKLAEVPVLVRELSDKEALEVQLIENLQREDLTALQEAEGYQRMLESKLYGEGWRQSVAGIAAKIGKSVSHVGARLSLLKLEAPAREALTAGKLDTSIAALVASIPDAAQQQEALKAILEGVSHWAGKEPMTFKEAKSHIEKKFRRSLNKAPFDPNDADLVPASIEREAPGACPKCPYRIAPNVCTNTPCFERKAQMAAAARAEKFVKQGRTVLTEKPAELFHENWNSGGKGTLKHGAGYIQASETCWEDPKHRSYKELLGKKVEPVVAFDQGGHPHELYPGKGMAEMLRTAGHEFREDKKAEKKKAKAQEDLGRLVNQELLKDMLHLVEQDKFEKAFLTCLLRDREGRSFILEKVFKLRGEPEYDTDDPKWWQGLTVKQLRSYLLETTLRAGDYDNSLDDAELWADDFGIKKHLVKDRVQVRLKAEAKAAADAKKGKDRKAGGTPALPGKAKK